MMKIDLKDHGLFQWASEILRRKLVFPYIVGLMLYACLPFFRLGVDFCFVLFLNHQLA